MGRALFASALSFCWAARKTNRARERSASHSYRFLFSSFLYFCVISMYCTFDDIARHGIQVGSECRIQFLKFRPQRFINERCRYLNHHCRSALPSVSIWLEIVTTKQGDKQRLRPCIRQREAKLDGGLGLFQLPDSLTNSIARRFRCGLLSRIGRPCKQHLYLLKFLNQAAFVVCIHFIFRALLSAQRLAVERPFFSGPLQPLC